MVGLIEGLHVFVRPSRPRTKRYTVLNYSDEYGSRILSCSVFSTGDSELAGARPSVDVTGPVVP